MRLTLDFRHRYGVTVICVLSSPSFTARLRSTGLFQYEITTNEDGCNRTDGAINQGEEEGIIHGPGPLSGPFPRKATFLEEEGTREYPFLFPDRTSGWSGSAPTTRV